MLRYAYDVVSLVWGCIKMETALRCFAMQLFIQPPMHDQEQAGDEWPQQTKDGAVYFVVRSACQVGYIDYEIGAVIINSVYDINAHTLQF